MVGPWAEGSRDLHHLIRVLGEQRVLAHAKAQGRPASYRELGAIISQIRRILSVNFVTAQAICLLNRISYLGAGGKAASERRSMMMRREDARRQERQSHYLAHIKGCGLSKVGCLFT